MAEEVSNPITPAVFLGIAGTTPGSDIGTFDAATGRTLLDVEEGATANASDAQLRDRSTHTGTQAQSTITDLVSDLAAKAPLSGASLVGATIATAAPGTNNTGLASTGFVQQELATVAGALEFKGTWNANTNSPSLSSGSGVADPGQFYIVSTAGSTSIDGISSWAVGDWIISDNVGWKKIVQTDAVASVFGRTGIISATSGDYNADQITETSGNKIMTLSERTKLAGIEAAATADQTNAEIETAYNAQVAVMPQLEAEARTSTAVRRMTAQRLGQSIAAALAEAGVGGGSGGVKGTPNSNRTSGAPAIALSTTEAQIGTITITPSSTSAQIMVLAAVELTKDTGTTVRNCTLRVRRGTTNGSTQVGGDLTCTSTGVASSAYNGSLAGGFDSPASVSQQTYSIRGVMGAGASTAARYYMIAMEVGSGGFDIVGLAEDTDPVASTDLLVTYDASASAYKKVLIENLPFGEGGSANYTPPFTGGVERSIAGKFGEMPSLKDFGAAMDGTTDDTAAFNLALTWMAGKSEYSGRRLLIDGLTVLDPEEFDWKQTYGDASTTGTLDISFSTIYLSGHIKVLSTMRLPQQVDLIGLSGRGVIQFGGKSTGVIEKGAVFDGPVLQLAGNTDLNNHLHNLSIFASNGGPALRIGYSSDDPGATSFGQVALVNMERIYLYQPVAGESALELFNAYWIWVKNFSFLAASDSYASVKIGGEVSPGVGANTSGLLHFEDGVIAGRGFVMDRSYVTGGGYESFFTWKNIHYESATSSFLTVAVTGGHMISQLTFENIEAADSSPGHAILYLDSDNGNTAIVQGVVFKQCPAQYVNALGGDLRQVRGVHFEDGGGSVFQGTTGYIIPPDLDGYPRGAAFASQGSTTMLQAFAHNGLNPVVVPAGFVVATPNALSGLTCDIGTGSVTAGKMAPDGSTGAIEVATTGGARLAAMASTGFAIADGDYIVAGAFVRMISGDQVRVRLYTTADGGDGFEDGAGAASQQDCMLGASKLWFSGWSCVHDVFKYKNTSGTDLANMYMETFTTTTFWVWSPFLIRIPVGLGWKLQDVVAWAGSLTGPPQSGGAGVAAQVPTLTLKTGRGATGSRPSASAVGEGAQWYDTTLDIPIWSNGTDWKNAAGTTV